MISAEGTLPLDCVYNGMCWGEKQDRAGSRKVKWSVQVFFFHGAFVVVNFKGAVLFFTHITKWGAGVWWINQYQMLLLLCPVLKLVLKCLALLIHNISHCSKWCKVQLNIYKLQLIIFFLYQTQQITVLRLCAICYAIFIRYFCYISQKLELFFKSVIL